MSLIADCYRRLTESSNADQPMRGYKVTNVGRTRKIGVACRSLHELKQKASVKLNITDNLDDIGIFLIDGSEIDEDYFSTLEPQTTLILRRPGEKVLTEADILYQMLRKANEELSRNGEKAAEFLTDKLKIKVALLNKALNKNDEKTLFSKKEDHPEWFEGLETNSLTKEAYLHRRCQDRIRGYLYKTIEQIRGSDEYLEDSRARKQLQLVIAFFKLQLRKDHYFGHYFDRSRADKAADGDDEPDSSAQLCCYQHCPCKMSDIDYDRYILGLDDDEVDAKRISPRTPLKKGQDSDLDSRNLEKEELLEAEKRCTYEIVERSEEDMKAMCDERGEFICRGVWNRDSCLYEDDHKINPYRSKEELVLFSTWNLDHQLERSRTLVPQLLEAATKGEIKEDVVTEFYNNLFTAKNLRLVHIVCHDKGSHK